MTRLNFAVSIGIFVGLIVSCSKNSANEPVATGAEFSIDPDQKAKPRDEGVSTNKAVTDTTLDGKGEVIAEASNPPTPPVEALPPQSSDESLAHHQDVEAKTVIEAETLGSDSRPESNVTSGVGVVVGRGPQLRYIKAWQLNIRSEPNRFSKIIGNLNGGTEVHVAVHGGWAKLDDGQWIRSRWLTKSRPKKFVGGPVEDDKPSTVAKKSKSKNKNKKKKKSSN